MNKLKKLPLFIFASSLCVSSLASAAVSDDEFNLLKDRFDQLVDAVEQNTGSSSSTHVGGYGELHYNNLEDGNGAKSKDIDFHRFVLFFNHEFNNDIRFVSEFELEHALAGEGKPGEVELEQAYVEFDINDNLQVKGGVFLMPVGIMNETHEPPAFYGVERNPVEKNIIPSTWWEAGAMVSTTSSMGLSFDLALSSGLDGGTSIRGGRQKVAKATANNLAITGRIKYTGISGLELAATAQVQNDMNQSLDNTVEGGTLLETHAIWNTGGLTVKALYAKWDIEGTAAVAAEKDSQNGGYIEAAYKVNSKFGFFARQNVWDNGGLGDTEKTQTDVGVNYWPHENVVVKFDITSQSHGDAFTPADEKEGFNLGIGYQF